ncbi:DUF4158 domain-containing protein [Nocardia sp. NPDC004750]
MSDDQVAAYERFVGDLTRSELGGFFLLDSTALDLIADKRGPHNRLGAALQVGTVRFLGHFLTEDPLDPGCRCRTGPGGWFVVTVSG